MGEKQPWFDVLGVSPSASPDEVRTAYLTLVKAHHPDRFAADPDRALWAEERLKAINAAYEDADAWCRVWSDPEPFTAEAAHELEYYWAAASDADGLRLILGPKSLVTRTIAFVLAFVIAFIAVVQTVNVLDLIIK